MELSVANMDRGTHEMRRQAWARLSTGAVCLLALSLAAGVGASEAAFGAVRTAKVAGRFYPEEQVELLDVISRLLERQPEPARAGKPRLLIVPHAGYQYSGLIAANGFRQLQGHDYEGVVVVGFTHRLRFDGASVDTRQAYETPLGEIPIHQEAVAILQHFPGIGYVEEAHETDEHSLEVELPFLQVVLDRFRLVPILLGSDNLEDVEQLATALAALAGLGDYLFVFSTDLSHYHAYDEATQIDEGTINAILFETPLAVHRLFARGNLEACGRGPIVTSLSLATKLGYLTRELLYYANSGDTAGNPSSVVGYAALAMYDPQPTAKEGGLSPEAGAALVRAARSTLELSLRTRDGPSPSDALRRHPELSRASGVFVTLRKAGALRGCIGRIESQEPLSEIVPLVALDAALRDPRFPPLAPAELSEVRVEVSVLTPPVKRSSAKEIVAGRDGVILEHEEHRGVFLPQVWEETGWTRLEFLRELASQKAGLPPDAWQGATLYTFQDQIFAE